jgi:sarcosine/dimethylglycine N-methyltransferase
VLDVGSGLGGPARQIASGFCLTGAIQPTPPLPWSLDGTDSYLATAEQLHDTIASSGFETLE